MTKKAQILDALAFTVVGALILALLSATLYVLSTVPGALPFAGFLVAVVTVACATAWSIIRVTKWFDRREFERATRYW